MPAPTTLPDRKTVALQAADFWEGRLLRLTVWRARRCHHRREVARRIGGLLWTEERAVSPPDETRTEISQHLRMLEETGVLRRTIERRTHRLWIQPGVLSVEAYWMDRRRPVGRLFGVVDE